MRPNYPLIVLFVLVVGAAGAPMPARADHVHAPGRRALLRLARDAGPATFRHIIAESESTGPAVVTPTRGGAPPVANDDTAATFEDTAVTIGDSTFLANDVDPDGDALTVQSCEAAVNGVVRRDTTGCTFTPVEDFVGTGSFTYTIRDAGGGTATATVLVTVIDANDPPVGAPDAVTVAEDSPALAIDVLANDSDEIGQPPLRVRSVTQPAHGLVTIAADGGRVTYQPAPNFSGADAFSYTVADAGGATATAIVSVTVSGVNDAPEATDDATTTLEDTPVTIDVAASDGDPDGDALTVTAVTQPANGTVTIQAGGARVTYAPGTNFSGIATFTYTVSDGNGGTDTAVVTVSVTAVNDPPVASNDAGATQEDAAITINVTGNDSDAEGNRLTVTAVSPAQHGTVVIIDGGQSVRYSPAPNFNGSDAFTYTISDGAGGVGMASVVVSVTALNDPPSATNDVAATSEGVPVTVNVRANDLDPDGDRLTVSGVTQAARGTVTIATGGSGVTYTPNPRFNGTDSFGYTISDGNGGTATAVVAVTVRPVNEGPPEARIDTPAGDPTVRVGERVNFTGTATDDGRIVSYSWNFDGGAPNQSVEDPGEVAFNTVGSFRVTFNATDDEGASDPTPDTRQVDVLPAPGPANTPPDATIDSPPGPVTIPAGQSVDFSGTGSDPDGRVVSYSWFFAGGNPSTSALEDPGSVVFDQPGLFTVLFNVTDDSGASDPTPDRRTITVTQRPPANEPPQATINSPSGPATILVGEGLFFAGSARDPDGTVVAYLWNFGGGAPNQNVEDPGLVRFTVAGTFTVSFNVTDDQSASDPTPPAVTVVVLGEGGVCPSRSLNVDQTTAGSESRVDGHDVMFVLRAVASNDLRADVNCDNRVDDTDVQLVLGGLGSNP